MPKLNVKLLQRVKRKILSEPKQFVMGHWFIDDLSEANGDSSDLPRKTIPNCGTAACIAGWTIALGSKQKPSKARDHGKYPSDEAATLLGIDPNGQDDLFGLSGWGSFREPWYKAKTFKGRAKVAARRIDAFIKDHR